MTPRVAVGILGPLTVELDGTPVAIGSKSQRTVLAALTVRPNELVTADKLIDALWGDAAPATAERTLQSHVSRLRRVLGGRHVVTTGGSGYTLEIDPAAIDAVEFERLLAAARDQEPAQALETLDAALDLWRGDALGEFAETDFGRLEGLRLGELRLEAVEDRAAAMVAVGHHRRLVAELEAEVARHPLRERLWLLLMTSMQRSGRQADAVRAADRYRRALAEIGLEPSPELLALETEVLTHSREPMQPFPMAGGTGNLPHRTTSFIGRDELMDDLEELLKRNRVATLTGPAGVGKTRLAIELGHRIEPLFGDGVWLVNLAPVTEEAGLAPRIARDIGIEPLGDVASSVLTALQAREAAIVLDNCEHLVDAVAPLAERIVQQCPNVTIVATSRERLGIEGEHARAVPPLEVATEAEGQVAAAIRLFADRAAAARPDFELAESREAVAVICRRLDGIPLAIEMAAARTRSMSAAEVAATLDESLLQSDRRTADPRHTTLRAAIEWSYSLLTEPEKRLFDRAAVFSGGFRADDAAAVCMGKPASAATTERLLDSLVERSMMMVEHGQSASRYRLLAVLRQHARAHLARADEAPALRNAHAAYFADRATGLRVRSEGPDEAAAVEAIYADIDNFRTAHGWALQRGDVDVVARIGGSLHFFGQFHPGLSVLAWNESAISAYPDENHDLWPALYAGAAGRAIHDGDLGSGLDYARAGIMLAGADSVHSRHCHEMTGEIALYQGRLADAQDAAATTIDLARRAGDEFHAAEAMLNLSLSHTYRGDHAAAEAVAAEQGEASRALGAPTLLALHEYLRGEILLDRDPDEAIRHFEEAIRLGSSVRNEFIAAIARVSATSLQARVGDPVQAIPAFAEVIRYWRTVGASSQQWTTLRNLVFLLVRVGDVEPAVTLLGASDQAETPSFGLEADRLESARAVGKDRLGDDRFDLAIARGEGMSETDAVEYALSALDRPG